MFSIHILRWLINYVELFFIDGKTKIVCISVIRWNPDAIVFNSYQAYGTPSYWVQLFFSESSGATLLSSSLQSNSSSNSVLASAITFQSSVDNKNYIRIKVTRFFALVTLTSVIFKEFENQSHFHSYS